VEITQIPLHFLLGLVGDHYGLCRPSLVPKSSSLTKSPGIFDLIYWASGWEKEIIPSANKLRKRTGQQFTKKQWKAIIVFLLSILLSFASFLHGTETPRVQTFEIYLDKLHPSMDNFRIIQLTDLHIGPTAGKAFIRDVVATTNSLRPDLVVISGDLADGRFSLFHESITPIENLKSKYGTFYVTGNHEYIRYNLLTDFD
jgi:hypothetical protein